MPNQHEARTGNSQVTKLEANAFGFNLTEADVQELRQIMRRECGIDLTLEQAWARGIELLAFAKMLVEALPPEE